MIIYKCHLFGINPPALTSSVVATPGSGQTHAHSSASWPPNIKDFFNLIQMSAINQAADSTRRQSDCSLCMNVERKFECVWCGNQCKHSEQCQELTASTCPPPRIDSVSIARLLFLFVLFVIVKRLNQLERGALRLAKAIIDQTHCDVLGPYDTSQSETRSCRMFVATVLSASGTNIR